jgi:hypothetical protein
MNTAPDFGNDTTLGPPPPDPDDNPPRDLHGRPYTSPEMRVAWYRVQAELAGPLTERSRAAIRRALRSGPGDPDGCGGEQRDR